MESVFEAPVIVAIVVASILVAKSAKLVRPDQRMIVERMGAYNRTCGPGWQFIVPFLERSIVSSLDEFPQRTNRDEPALVETEPSHAHDTKASDPNGWWVRVGEKSHWAPETETLRSWLREGRLGRNDLVWEARGSRWIRSTEVQELQSHFYPFSPIWVKWRYDLFIAIWPIVVLLIGVVGVSVMSAFVNAGLLSAVQALSWHETPGRITHSAVLAQGEQMVTGVTITRFQPDIRYEYQVTGRSYESDSVDLSAPGRVRESPDSADAKRVVARYSPGDQVTVYFDSAHPTSATLDRGEERIVGFVIGLVMTAGAAIVLGLRLRRRAARARVRNSAFPVFPSASSPPPPPA
ncbi:MAG: DUF3592 domain-containing protein [Vicinamibacteria bacterium]|nr:DUF3592 domain-containing protein [Vicinamibacteria bacterium]